MVSRKLDEKPMQGSGSQAACTASRICKRDQRQPAKAAQAMQRRNQKQNRDLQLKPKDTSTCQEQLEVFPHLAAGRGKPLRAPWGTAVLGRLPTPHSSRSPAEAHSRARLPLARNLHLGELQSRSGNLWEHSSQIKRLHKNMKETSQYQQHKAFFTTWVFLLFFSSAVIFLLNSTSATLSSNCLIAYRLSGKIC